MDAVFNEILLRVKEKTLAGKANWQMSKSANEYRLILIAGTITISTYSNNYITYYSCQLLNNNGDVLFSEIQKESDRVTPSFSLMGFYNDVVDAYTNKKQVVSSIMQQLKDDEEIGMPSSTQSDLSF